MSDTVDLKITLPTTQLEELAQKEITSLERKVKRLEKKVADLEAQVAASDDATAKANRLVSFIAENYADEMCERFGEWC